MMHVWTISADVFDENDDDPMPFTTEMLVVTDGGMHDAVETAKACAEKSGFPFDGDVQEWRPSFRFEATRAVRGEQIHAIGVTSGG